MKRTKIRILGQVWELPESDPHAGLPRCTVEGCTSLAFEHTYCVEHWPLNTSTAQFTPYKRSCLERWYRRVAAIRAGDSIETRPFVADAIEAFAAATEDGAVPDAFRSAPQLTPKRPDMLQHMQDVLAVRDALWECELEWYADERAKR